MFYSKQDKEKKENYIQSLKVVGSLSKLFSDSKVPYLYYRVAEKIFCDSFSANDLSRGDIALDASVDGVGIGLKTFLSSNNKSFQKIAEFNRDRASYSNLKELELIKHISFLRNNRVEFAQNLSKVKNSCYHCVTRDSGKFYIYEESMDLIDIDNIVIDKIKSSTIIFNDKKHEYSFNISKSTLLKRFNTYDYIEEFGVDILDNPLEDIKNCLLEESSMLTKDNLIKESIYLPLYSFNNSKGKFVPSKSGLNQWNASGRVRDINEIYIPIRSEIHKIAPEFFPNRDIEFTLHLPSKDTLRAKVCQDNSKALMSNPNKALGKWLLRDVLKLKEGELLTYEKLSILGIDSVKIDKIDSNNYKINFASLDSYEDFKIKNLDKI